jgi:acyl-CoA dehydrogenase
MPAATDVSGADAVDFNLSQSQTHWLTRVRAFIEDAILPAAAAVAAERAESREPSPTMERLKEKARAEGLWNLFLPPSPEHDTDAYRGAGLTNLDYALCAEEMGRVGIASEVFNCAAPDTGNMEVLHRYGTAAQKDRWLKPLMAGEIRSAFLMTEPEVASSDATNIETGDPPRRRPLRRRRPQVVVDRRRRPALQDRDPDGQDRPGGRPATGSSRRSSCPSTRRACASSACSRSSATRTRPRATARWCWRRSASRPGTSCSARAAASRSRKAGSGRAASTTACAPSGPPRWRWRPWRAGSCPRVAFGKKISEQSVWEQRVAEARIDIEMTRLLCLKAADMMDKVGNKGAKLEIAMIKVAAPRVALKVIDDAIQAHGGAGVSEDFGLAKMYAHIRTLRLADGPDEVHNRAIARLEFGRYTNARPGAPEAERA